VGDLAAGVEGYEALVVGARERKRGASRSSAAGVKFSWPKNAMERSSSRVGGLDISASSKDFAEEKAGLEIDVLYIGLCKMTDKGLGSQKRFAGMKSWVVI